MGAFILPILSGLAGGLTNRPQTQTQTTSGSQSSQQLGSGSGTSSGMNSNSSQSASRGTQTGTTASQQTSSGRSTSTPNLTEETQQFLNKIRQAYMSNLSSPEVGLNGYEAAGLKQINDVGDLKQRALQNFMAARGFNSSPVAATAEANLEAQRLDKTADFRASIPLLQRDRYNAQLAEAGNFFSRIPLGTTTEQEQTGASSGSSSAQTEAFTQQFLEAWNQAMNSYQTQGSSTGQSSGQTQATNPGNVAGGVATGIANALAMLIAQGKIPTGFGG